MEPHVESFVGLFTTDTELNIQIWDSVLERMTGISAEAAAGQKLLELIPDVGNRSSVLARFKQALNHGTVEVLSPGFHRFLIPCKPQFPSKHFSEMRQHVRIAPLQEGGVVRGLAVTIEDVTRRMESEIDLAAALKDQDPAVRLDAARKIAAGEDTLPPESASLVIDALDDPDWKVRRNLVTGISRRGADDAIAALLRAMRDKHLHFGMVNGALEILRASSVDTSATLVEFLRSEETDLRMHAALALGEQRDPGVIPHLIEAARDEDINVRYHAIEALGKLRAKEALELLTSIAEKREFFLSFAALDAIAEIGSSSVADRIIPLLQEQTLRPAALRTLGRSGRPSEIANIIRLLDEDQSQTVVIADASVSLHQHHLADPQDANEVLRIARETITTDQLSNLSRVLGDREPASLGSLIPFAGWFPVEAISESLCQLLNREEIREQVIGAMRMQGEVALTPLIGCLESDDPATRVSAARTIGKIGHAHGVSPLIQLLEQGDVEDVLASIDALGSIDTPESVAALTGVLDDPDPRVREAAVRALGRLAKKELAEVFISKSKDGDERVRHAAIEQIPSVAGHSGLAAIVEALRKDTPRVRAAAARAVTLIEHADAVEPLREALSDPDSWTRYFAVRGIGARRDVASANRLKEMIDADPAEHVRMAAKEVSSELGI